MDVIETVVCDLGSAYAKHGKGGDSEPCDVIRTIAGRPFRARNPELFARWGAKDYWRGPEVIGWQSFLTLYEPIKAGEIESSPHGVDRLEPLMHYLSYHSEIVKRREIGAPEEHPFIFTGASCHRGVSGLIAQLMFETFNVPALYMQPAAVLQLFASGRTTGVVLDIGDGGARCTPVYEGHALFHAAQHTTLGGRSVSTCLAELLGDRCPGFSDPWAVWSTACLTNVVGRVALDYKIEMKREASKIRSYALPDGRMMAITYCNEDIRAAEVLFNEQTRQEKGPSIQELVPRAISNCDVDLHDLMWRNVVVAGGCSMMAGLPERLQQELAPLSPALMPARLIVPPERDNSAWLGGSIVSAMSSFQHMWATLADYEEQGLRVVRRFV